VFANLTEVEICGGQETLKCLSMSYIRSQNLARDAKTRKRPPFKAYYNCNVLA
jgi:hypothetical protein